MRKPMLNAIQKARLSTAMKSKNPKMNPGFDSLPKKVQAQILNKKAKLSVKKPKKSIKIDEDDDKKKGTHRKFSKNEYMIKLSDKKGKKLNKVDAQKAARKRMSQRAKAAKKPGATSPEEVARIKAERIKKGLDPVAGKPKNPNKGPKRKIVERADAKRRTKAEIAQAKAKQRLEFLKKKMAKAPQKPKASQTAGAIMRRERKMN